MIATVADVDRGDKVLVKMIDELDDAILKRRRDGEEVKHGEVLDVFAEAYAAGVRADWLVELGGEQKDGEVFVDASNAATIELNDVDSVRLKKLLEHDAVLAVLSCGDADLGDLPADARVA